ncbi:MAG: beta-propeller domain-containing protein [Firmicutes bacterium]|nr:beta-propeller domain-containing protein [Bacillota bacterium]
MSKLKNHFDDIKATDELKQKVSSKATRAEKETVPVLDYALASNSNRNGTRSQNFSTLKNRNLIIIISLVMATILILGIIAPFVTFNALLNDSPDFNRARQIQNSAHLQQVLNFQPRDFDFNFSGGCSSDFPTNDRDNGGGNYTTDGAGRPGLVSPDSTPPPGTGGNSETNVQIQGMDEGDIVRNDGNFIYRLSPNGLTIVETNFGQINHVTSIQYQNFSPIEMFVRGDTMVIIGGTFNNPQTSWNDSIAGGWFDLRFWHSRVQIRIYDIFDRTEPTLKQFYEIDGIFQTSRISVECETLFFVVNYFPRRWSSETRQTDVRRPYYRTSKDAEFSPFPVENMFYFRRNRATSYMILGRINLGDLESEPKVRAYLSSANIISVGLNNLYTSTTRGGQNWGVASSERRSYVSRFCLETLNFTGYVVVQGEPPSRHAIDEYRGYLRIATTYGNRGQWMTNEGNTLASAIFVFDSRLRLVSSITGIAPQEQMDSAAFDGNFGFISTSPPDLIWDPLYTIDLTDPRNPILSEGLETDGINDYLRPIRGTPFVIGIGQDAPPEGSALQTGIKIELYYMRPGTGKMPESRAKFTVYGNATFAEVLHNPRALLFMHDEETNQGIVGFAAESAHWGWSGGMSSFNGTLSQGFFLFTFDANEGTMEFVGETEQRLIYGHYSTVVIAPTFSNFDTTEPLSEMWNNLHWSDTWQARMNVKNYYINRAIVNQGYLFTISDNLIAGYCLATMTRVSEFKGN